MKPPGSSHRTDWNGPETTKKQDKQKKFVGNQWHWETFDGFA